MVATGRAGFMDDLFAWVANFDSICFSNRDTVTSENNLPIDSMLIYLCTWLKIDFVIGYISELIC